MSTSPRPYEASANKFDIKKNFWYIIAGVAVIALIATAIWYSVSQNSSPSKTYSFTTLINKTDAVFGKKDAAVAIVFFEDYTCGVCAESNPDFDKVTETYKDRISVAYKPVDILKQGSDVIARSAYAAFNQNKFMEYSAQAYLKKDDMRIKRESTMVDIAKGLGLDMIKWENDRNFDDTYKVKTQWNDNDVKNTRWVGGIERTQGVEQPITPGSRIKEKNSGITATPTTALLKNGEVVMWWDGSATLETITKRIDTVLAL